MTNNLNLNEYKKRQKSRKLSRQRRRAIDNKNNSNNYNVTNHHIPLLNRIIKADRNNWSQFKDHVSLIIEEVNSYINMPNNDVKKITIFFDFLHYKTDYVRKLDNASKVKLYNIANKLYDETVNDIKNGSYKFEKSEIHTLNDIFNVFLNMELSDESEIQSVLKKSIDIFLDKENQKSIFTKVFDKKNEPQIISDFSWMINTMFSMYKDKLGFEKSFSLFEKLIELDRKILHLGLNDKYNGYLLKPIFNSYRNFHYNFNIQNQKKIDDKVEYLARDILNDIKNKNFNFNEKYFKRFFYMEYVSELCEPDKKSVNENLYEMVTKKDIFPHSHVYTIPGSRMQVTIFSETKLSDKNKTTVEGTIKNDYQRFEKLKKETGVSDVNPNAELSLHLFDSNESYQELGPFFKVDTQGGGYADYNPCTKGYDAYIYWDKNNSRRNGEHKEGGNWRNFGHEFAHLLTYRLLGHEGLNKLLTTQIEGFANWFGNEKCFLEGAQFLKNYKGWPTLERIVGMGYGDGSATYHFGSAMAGFMFERYPQVLGNVLEAAKKGQEVKPLMDKWVRSRGVEDDFKAWLTRENITCTTANVSEISKQEQTRRTSASVLDSRQKMLPKFVQEDTLPPLKYTEKATETPSQKENSSFLTLKEWIGLIGVIGAAGTLIILPTLLYMAKRANQNANSKDLGDEQSNLLGPKLSCKLKVYIAYQLFLAKCKENECSSNDGDGFMEIFKFIMSTNLETGKDKTHYEWKDRQALIDKLKEENNYKNIKLTKDRDNKLTPESEWAEKTLMTNCILWGIWAVARGGRNKDEIVKQWDKIHQEIQKQVDSNVNHSFWEGSWPYKKMYGEKIQGPNFPEIWKKSRDYSNELIGINKPREQSTNGSNISRFFGGFFRSVFKPKSTEQANNPANAV